MAAAGIGHVTHYYRERHVAALALTETLRVGDWLHVVGHTTDFVQPVESLQINHQAVTQAGPGDAVAVAVNDRVRAHDALYRVTTAEAQEIEDGRLPERAW
jgi:putative protease